jgi:hypothetical protein
MSVRELWRAATGLFWDQPVLWLPVVGGDLAAFSLHRLQTYFTFPLIQRLLLDPAALLTGSRRDVSSHALILKAAAIGGILRGAATFAHIILYAMAFFVIAALIRARGRREQRAFALAAKFVKSRIRTICRLSLLIFALVIALTIPLGFLVDLAMKMGIRPIPTWAVYAFVSAALCGIAYLIVPIALQAVAEKRLDLTVRTKRQARAFAVLTVGASCVLSYCLQYVATTFLKERAFHGVLAAETWTAIGSSLSALPYVVLFIALTLIVDDEAGGSESTHNGSASTGLA